MNFIQGTLDLLILKALADGPLHGYDVVEWIRRVTRGAIQIEDGALYASLHRMEAREWLEHEWRVSPKGRRAMPPFITVTSGRAARTSGRTAAGTERSHTTARSANISGPRNGAGALVAASTTSALWSAAGSTFTSARGSRA